MGTDHNEQKNERWAMDGTDTAQKRRAYHSPSRKNRLIAGGGSAPLAIIICYALNHALDIPKEDETLNIAINTLVGSAVTVLMLCANDLRSIFLDHYGSKRVTDKRHRG